MSRTLGAIAGHIAGTAHQRVNMLRFDLLDGTTLAVTDHDRNLGYDLGDGSANYLASTGILPSDLSLSTGFEGSDIEVQGPIGDVVTRAAIIGGRYDDAEFRLFQVNWSDLTQGAIKLLKGRVVLAEVIAGKFKLTLHGEVTRFAQSIGRTISAYCDADFGDARCGIVAETLAATVTAVTDERAFTVSYVGTKANDYFNRGTVTFQTGALTGTRPVEIFDFTGGITTGSVALWTSLAEAPLVGDTLTLERGCSKIRSSDDATLPTCMTYDNLINFRGFPDVPGTDQVLRYPNPAG